MAIISIPKNRMQKLKEIVDEITASILSHLQVNGVAGVNGVAATVITVQELGS